MKWNMLLLLITFSVEVFADGDDLTTISCDPNTITLNSTSYEELQKDALGLATELCLHSLHITDEDIGNVKAELKMFTDKAREAYVEAFPEISFPGIKKNVGQWHDQTNRFDQNTDFTSLINIIDSYQPGNSRLKFQLPPFHEHDLDFALNGKLDRVCAKVEGADNCRTAAEQFRYALSPAFSSYRNAVLKNNQEKHNGLVKSWSSFMDESRYQWPWEVWATTQYYSNEFNGPSLVAPPKLQIILLHPTLVVERIDNLERGSRDSVAIALEWAGLNWWEKGFGFSLTSLYWDRDEADSIGHGFTLHIKSKYSIGFVHRGNGNNGVFFNVDLTEWFTDKKEKYKKYQQYF